MENECNPQAGPRKLAGQAIALADRVAFLARPDAYPDAPPRVQAVETHMSWVFLTELFAHKMKKPVRNEFLDYATLDARRRFCEEEVRLNQRLAPAVYIGTAPLSVDAAGQLRIDGDGEIVDWLVRMRRLPRERMLDHAIEQGTARVEELEAVALLLADFYRNAIRVAIPPSGFRRRLADAIAANRRVLEAPEFELPRETVNAACGTLVRALEDQATLFEKRVRRGRVIEGHGDLRPAHVSLDPEPAVIDCLEFDRDFRVQDWVDELAFLAMECERLGSPGAGKVILETCCNALDDKPPEPLINFYKSFRALLRAKLSILHLRDEAVRDRDAWRPLALDYLRLAGTYAERLIHTNNR
jgi:aminoglycoside phosphotransferase family enzyme